MMNKRSKNKILFEIIRDDITERGISQRFSQDRISALAQQNIAAAYVITSEPVDKGIYLSLVNSLKSAGIRVLGFYFNPTEEENLESFCAVVHDCMQSRAEGGCLIISYRSAFAPIFVAAMQVAAGLTVENAISTTAGILKNHSYFEKYRYILERFSEVYHSLAVPVGMIVAVRIIPGSTQELPAHVLTAVASQEKEQTASSQKHETTRHADAQKRSSLQEPAAVIERQTGKRLIPVFRSIRFKLITIISFIIVASLTGVIFLATYYFKKDNDLRVRENNMQLAEVIATKMRTEIEKYRIVMSLMLNQNRSGESSTQESLLRAGEDELLYAGIAVPAPAGRYVFAKAYQNRLLMNRLLIGEKEMAALNAQSLTNISPSFAGETIVSNSSPKLNHLVATISFPFERTSAGAVKSVLVGHVRLDSLLKTFKNPGIAQVFMVNVRGDVIAHPDESYVRSGANLASLPICKIMMTSAMDNGQTRYRDKDGLYHLASFKKIAAGGFTIIAAVEEQKAFEAVYEIQRRNLLIAGLVLTAAILFIYFFGKTITTPILRLVRATRQIMAGQYEVDIIPTSRDEIGHLTSTFVEMGRGLAEREKIKNAFGKFVNKDVAEAALRDELRLGGERKKVAILFSDIRSFTAISEKLDPEEVVEFLNEYISRMVNCVNVTRGVVDKFIGDAIMAVWGAPVSYRNDTQHAVDCALMMRNELIAFNRGRGGPKRPIIHIGCGINTGEVLAGQIGSEERMEYTVIGDAVNLASRIEALNKPFGTDILISEDSYRLVPNLYAVEKMRTIRVKGKMEPQQIYAVLGRLDDETRPRSLQELRSMLGLEYKELSEKAIDAMVEHGEEKYEIVEK